MSWRFYLIVISFYVAAVHGEVPWKKSRESVEDGNQELLDVESVVDLISEMMNHLDAEDASFYAEKKLALKDIWRNYGVSKKTQMGGLIMMKNEEDAFKLLTSKIEAVNSDDSNAKQLLDQSNVLKTRSRRSVGLNDFPHTVSAAVDDSEPAASISSPNNTLTTKKENTTELLRKLWRKFLRPINNVTKSMKRLEQLQDQVGSEFCDVAANKLLVQLRQEVNRITQWLSRFEWQLNELFDLKLAVDGLLNRDVLVNNKNNIQRPQMTSQSDESKSLRGLINKISKRSTSLLVDDSSLVLESEWPRSAVSGSMRLKQRTVDQLSQIWQKFLRPINNITKSVQQLEAKMSHNCELIAQKIEHQMVAVFSGARDQLNQLETKINHLKEKFLTQKDVDIHSDPTTDLWSFYNLSSCSEIGTESHLGNGVYQVTLMEKPTKVYCDFDSHGGGWTVIQRRGLFPHHQENFHRDWEAYKKGFGDLGGEFWLGNDLIHALTTRVDSTLLVELEDFEGNYAFAFYDQFGVDSEEQLYRLNIGGYHGNATDSFSVHHRQPFSTRDRLMEGEELCCNCANYFEGGWWYNSCFEAHLNGPYFDQPLDNGYFKGIIWELWKGDYSLKSAQMKIRPRAKELSDDYEVEDP